MTNEGHPTYRNSLLDQVINTGIKLGYTIHDIAEKYYSYRDQQPKTKDANTTMMQQRAALYAVLYEYNKQLNEKSK